MIPRKMQSYSFGSIEIGDSKFLKSITPTKVEAEIRRNNNTELSDYQNFNDTHKHHHVHQKSYIP